jgi:hypothetical protein
MEVMSEPKYMLRLDLVNNATATAVMGAVAAGGSDASSSSFSAGVSAAGVTAKQLVSYHLQADHANMKQLEAELQRAVDEVGSVHGQRIIRYMS